MKKKLIKYALAACAAVIFLGAHETTTSAAAPFVKINNAGSNIIQTGYADFLSTVNNGVGAGYPHFVTKEYRRILSGTVAGDSVYRGGTSHGRGYRECYHSDFGSGFVRPGAGNERAARFQRAIFYAPGTESCRDFKNHSTIIIVSQANKNSRYLLR